MTDHLDQSEARRARDGRALMVADLLRSGWTGQEVSVGLKVIDAGGGVALAMSAMREAQRERREATPPARSVGADHEPTPRGQSEASSRSER